MKVHLILLFLLVAFVPSVKAVTYTVVDEGNSQFVMNFSNNAPSIVPNFVQGEPLNQFLSSLFFTIYGNNNANPVIKSGNGVFTETPAFIIISNRNNGTFSQNNIIGSFLGNGLGNEQNDEINLVFENDDSSSGDGGVGAPNGGGDGGIGAPDGGGSNPGGTPPPINPPEDVPEPPMWALLIGSLAGLVFIHRLRFAHR